MQYLALVYEPIGLISAILVRGKMIFRKICNLKIGWDTQLPDQLRYKWKKWKRSLPTSVSVPRSIPEFQVYVQKIDLRAFGDIYSIVHLSGGVSQGLLCSKLRLYKKDLIIPRLELFACHMYINRLDNARKAILVTQWINWLHGLAVQLRCSGFMETVITNSL